MLLLIWWPLTVMVGANNDSQSNLAIAPQQIATAITPLISNRKWPTNLSYISGEKLESVKINYTIDPGLQKKANDLLKKYDPDYAVIVAIDPKNGAVLAMADSMRHSTDIGHLALLNSFPAASISKIITAAAILNENKATPSTKHAFNGRVTSLYKKNVFEHQNTKYTRYFSLTESFARSANTIFGRLGAIELGGKTLLHYAEKMGFNHRFFSDLTFDNGQIELDTENPWQVAESASGYTIRNTLSPLHAAAIGALAVNGGKLVTPHIVDSLHNNKNEEIYDHFSVPAPFPIISKSTADNLKTIMQATADEGSARRAFRGFHRGQFKNINVGGKTGSLTGFNPKGRYDWFVGFGEHNDKSIAYAILCINKEKWYVKSSQLARQLLEYYYSRGPHSAIDKSAYAKN